MMPALVETVQATTSELERTFEFLLVPQFAVLPELLLQVLLSSPVVLGEG